MKSPGILETLYNVPNIPSEVWLYSGPALAIGIFAIWLMTYIDYTDIQRKIEKEYEQLKNPEHEQPRNQDQQGLESTVSKEPGIKAEDI